MPDETQQSPQISTEPQPPTESQNQPNVIMPSETPPASVNSMPTFTPPPVEPSPITMLPARRKPILPAIIAVVVILILATVGYVFALYLPNTPSHVYNASLTNSAQALDSLISYTKQQSRVDYKSVAFNGTINVQSSSASFDLSISGAGDKNANANAQVSADILGQKATAYIRSIQTANDGTPDVYVQVSGVKNFLDTSGLSQLDGLDGQWVVIDHTLVDTYLADLKQQYNMGSSSSNATDIPSYAAVQDAISKVQNVNRQYVFTTDVSKAVLVNPMFVAKESVSGRFMNHYKVSYSQPHLEAYAKALGQALDSSQLNDWSKKTNDGKNLSDALDFTSLESDIQKAKTNYTFDLWADTKAKLISKVAFTNPADSSSAFTISQGYTGGSTYPFSIEFKGNGGSNKSLASVSLDTQSNKVTGKFIFDLPSGGNTSTVGANFTLAPSNNPVNVTAPSGAKSVIDILNSLGLGGLTNTPPSSLTPLSL